MPLQRRLFEPAFMCCLLEDESDGPSELRQVTAPKPQLFEKAPWLMPPGHYMRQDRM